ncbi:multiple epidermal growth factor-like domains protein 9 [Carcharodon carcharias]|uniref:multiple epidermal growth factor-like domains protein 9 n=1 Tax=Carcharodon carcharias TaxID=13397 RepID=UPI001B7E46A8|nr:multiple epidermal growth factor-like domains protein 9 [Carcharodon carcharias]
MLPMVGKLALIMMCLALPGLRQAAGTYRWNTTEGYNLTTLLDFLNNTSFQEEISTATESSFATSTVPSTIVTTQSTTITPTTDREWEELQEYKCNCSIVGSINESLCNTSSGQCDCLPGYFGLQCSDCAEGFYRSTINGQCTLCGCNDTGAANSQCDRCTVDSGSFISMRTPSPSPHSLPTLADSVPTACSLGSHQHQRYSSIQCQTFCGAVRVQQNRFAVIDDHLVYDQWLAIPAFLQLDVLQKIHQGHLGITKCRTQAQSTALCPDISKAIQETIASCQVCALCRQDQREPLTPMQFPHRPRERLDIDLFVYNSKSFLIVVDDFSRWLEVKQLYTTTTATVFKALKDMFVNHGIPDEIMPDNDPQLSKAYFTCFHHRTSSPSTEKCFCKDGVSGLKCNQCQILHYKFSEAGCRPCQCNNLSKACDHITGICLNCTGNTKGHYCEKCKDSFYRKPGANHTAVCERCPCSVVTSSGSCHIVSGEAVCDQCNPGYFGSNCDECADGYYNSDSICVRCECNNNTDVDSKQPICDSESGRCLSCTLNTTGFNCEKCAEGYVGDPMARNCQIEVTTVPTIASTPTPTSSTTSTTISSSTVVTNSTLSAKTQTFLSTLLSTSQSTVSTAEPMTPEISWTQFNIAVLVVIIAVVVLLMGFVAGVYVYREYRNRKLNAPFWTIELKEDNISFSSYHDSIPNADVSGLLEDDVTEVVPNGQLSLSTPMNSYKI